VKLILSFFAAIFMAYITVSPVNAQFDDRRQDTRERINRANQEPKSSQEPRAAIPDHLRQRAPVARQQMAPGLPQQAYREEEKPRGFFDWLFGNKPAAPIQQSPQDAGPTTFIEGEGLGGSNVGGRRTICVRTCDGAFMPISTGRSSQRDTELCTAQCPGAETKVFALNGDRLEDAVGKSGESYSTLPNALKFRQGIVQGCSCRPTGKTWAEFSANKDDPTMRKGDSVLTPEQARRMSLAPEAKKLDTNDKDKNNYILKPVVTTAVKEEEVTMPTGEVRTINFESNKKVIEVGDQLTPLQKLLQKHKDSKTEETGSIDKKG
jgi:Protein of unknown function (DUF2865)